jgi:hypothetical protein
MNKITSADVSAWLKEQLTALHEKYEYAAIYCDISQCRDSVMEKTARFSIYTGTNSPASREKKSLEECISDMATQTPQSLADAKRQAALKLLAEAEELEAKTETQP